MPPEQSIPVITETAHSSRLGNIEWVVLFAGVLVTIVVGTMYFLDMRNQQGVKSVSDSHIILTSSQAPLIQAMEISIKNKTATPIIVEGLGSATLTDIAVSKDKNIYLIANTAGSESNIYTADTHNTKAGLSQRTFSHSAKFSLSYDAQSDSVAYISVKGKDAGVVTVLTQATSTEKTYGVGANPTLLKGGFFVVYQKGADIVSANIQTKEIHTLFSVPVGGAYAIDGEGMRAVVYDPQTRTLQHFSLEGMMSASFISFKKEEGIAIQGRVLGISGDSLASLIQAEEGVSITIGKDKPIFIGGVTPNEHARLTIYHD